MPKATRAQEEREKRADPDEPPDAEELKLVALEARRQRLQSTPYQAVPAQVGPPQLVRGIPQYSFVRVRVDIIGHL